jgi:hypothetical protein
MQTNDKIFNNFTNKSYKSLYCNNKDTPTKIIENNNNHYNSYSQNKKNSSLSPNLFRNRELQHSLSIKVNDNSRKSTNLKLAQNYNSFNEPKSSFLTMIPISNSNFARKNLPEIKFQTILPINKFKYRSKSFYLKRRTKKNLHFKCFNDDQCFSTSKPKKKFTFPKNYFIIKEYTVNHDTNIFNLKHIFTDYTKEYEKNSYRIKQMVQKDKFVNFIKSDILKLKFHNRIKPYDELVVV